jgi:alpha-L-fucosidase
VVGGSFNDTKRQPFTGEDMRFTVKGDTLYAILLGWPESGTAVIRSLSSHLPLYRHEAFEITLLGSHETRPWIRDADGLKVQLPTQKPAGPAYTLKLTLKMPLTK